uniref:uncharacterized protein LOC122606487 isoform X2 n=1 Tax=Erigeron canadensis TaxID=72917 RepID=UPI001CB9CAD5|nr:uncharacterized protein LOC122606487 isoform X2 [Erigeron canadensis]
MEDYHNMKRKELQALCKKHNIPAGSANSVLADKLSQLLNVQEKQKPITRQRACLKSRVETTDEGEAEASKREAKKVKFCPTNDIFEYGLTSVKKQQGVVRKTGARRKSVAKQVGNPVVNNDIELVEDAVQIPVKLTRSRVHILEKDDVLPNVGRRQGRSAAKYVIKEKDENEELKANLGKPTRSKVHVSGNCGAVQLDEDKQSKRPVKGDAKASKSVKKPVVIRARVTRSKAQSLGDADIDPDMKSQDKKKSGRQVAKAVQLAEPAKEVVDIPVRITRTRGQTVKEDIGNTVAKPQDGKKRTRKEMKATDQSSNSSSVTLEDNQEHPKRKSLRTREAKVEDADEVDKVQMVDNRRVTRSRVTRSSISKTENKVEAQRKSKRGQQLDEPLEHAVKKNAKRRGSATQPVKIEEVPHPEEPVDAPAGRVTRRESIVQKAQGKGIDPEKTEVVHHEKHLSGTAARVTRRKSPTQEAQSKVTGKPSFGKRQPVKETEIPDSPKSVGRNESRRQCGSLSVISEGLKDKEIVIRSGNDASDDKMKAVAFSTISPKSKKRRGTLIIDGGPVEPEYVSPVEFSTRSMRSASKSEGKAVAHSLQNSPKNQLQSGSKTRSPGGAIGRDGSSKKRAKLSLMKPSESEDHGEKSNIEKTPISKPVTSELGERVTKSEHTHVIDGSHRRFTRSAVGSNRKEPRQTAIKQQPIGDLSSDKTPKFRHDSAVKTAPGRVTRSGIKRAGTVAISLSERVAKKKQQRESAHQRKPYVGEPGHIPDVVIIGAQSEMPKEVTDQILGHAGNISASEYARLSAEVAKESKSETAITMESLSSLFDEQPSGVESPSNFEVETLPGAHSNVKTSLEATPDAISDGCNVQNQMALDAAKSVLKSGRPETYDKELVNLGSTSKDLQSGVGAEEPVISVDVTVGMEESDRFGDDNCTYDSASYSQAFKQPGIMSKPEGEEETEKAEEGKRGSAQKPVMQEPVSEDNSMHGNIEKLHNCDMANREVSHGELDREMNKDDTVVQLTAGDELVGLSMEEDDTKDDIVTAHDSLVKQNVLLMGKDTSFGLDMDGHGVAYDRVDTVKEPTQGPELETVPLIIDVCEIPILGNMLSHGEDHVPSSVEREDEADKANSEHESNPKPLTDDKVLGIDDEYNVSRLSKPLTDPSSAHDIHKTPLSGKDSSIGLPTERCGVEYNLIDAGKEPAPEPEFEVAPSTANDVHKMSSLGKPDGVDGGVNATRESDGEDLVLCCEGEGDDADNTFKENEPNSKLIHDGVSDTSVLGKDDYDSITRLFEPTLDPSSANDIVEIPISGDDNCSDIAIERSGVADTGNEHALDHEFELAPSAGNDVQEMLSLGESESANASMERETDSVPSTGGKMPADGEPLVLSGGGGEGQAYNTKKEHELKLKQFTDDVSDTSVLGKGDDYNITRLRETTPDPSTNDRVDTPFSVNDIFGESDNPIYDHDVEDGVNNGRKELESGLDSSVTSYSPNVPVLGNNSYRNGQDGESEHEHEQLIRIDMCAIDEQCIGGVGSEPDQNESTTEDVIRSTIEDDAHEESSQDIDKDDMSDYFGHIYGIENAVEVMDTENDNWNEQKVTRTSAPDESAYLKGGDSISTGMNTAQLSEETEQKIESEHALSDKKEQPGTAIENAVEMSNSQLVGDLKAQETPTRGEKKFQKENMEDWGNYSSRVDGFQSLVLANKKDNLLAKSIKDNQVSDLESSARAGSLIQESSSLAADMVNSVNKLEYSSKNVTDGESDQAVDLLKGDANMPEEDLYWSGENTRGTATGEENELCGVPSFEHFPNKYFENEVDGSIDWLGKNKHLELKGDQYDLSSEAASTSNHHESSVLNVSSMRSGVFGEKASHLKGSKTGDNLALDKGT